MEVRDSDGRWVATFTPGARTVTLSGPPRRFAEATAAHAVAHAIWVRVLSQPFGGEVDEAWLEAALAANAALEPDILVLAMQYTRGSPPLHEDGLQVAGEAGYGPLRDGEREEGSDFNDYLGMAWTYADGSTDAPECRQFRCLDCSGYVRMVWGYRRHAPSHAPLALSRPPSPDRSTIPRRAHEIFTDGPGVVVVDRGPARPRDLSCLRVGDLVFFDADPDDGPRLDHVGLYLGPDEGGHHRFLSSRKGHNGPTLGDVRGRSLLDGSGLYARSFRAVRRL